MFFVVVVVFLLLLHRLTAHCGTIVLNCLKFCFVLSNDITAAVFFFFFCHAHDHVVIQTHEPLR